MSQASREGLGRALQVEAEHEQEGAVVPVSHMQLVFLDLEVLTGDLASIFLPMKRSLVWWVGLEVLGRGEAGMILPILRVWVADGTFKTSFFLPSWAAPCCMHLPSSLWIPIFLFYWALTSPLS